MPSPSSLVLLSSRNSATMVTWRHTSPLFLPLPKVLLCVIMMRCQAYFGGIHSILAICILDQTKLLVNHNLYSIYMTVHPPPPPPSVTYSSWYVLPKRVPSDTRYVVKYIFWCKNTISFIFIYVIFQIPGSLFEQTHYVLKLFWFTIILIDRPESTHSCPMALWALVLSWQPCCAWHFRRLRTSPQRN